jgi:hypothetical protein
MLGKDSVEDGETGYKQDKETDFIFSNRILANGGKRTFADLSKKINNKYKLRVGDKLAEASKKRDLDFLATQQENLKDSLGLNNNQPIMANGGFKLNANDYLTPENIEKDRQEFNTSDISPIDRSTTPFLDITGNNLKEIPATSITPTTNTSKDTPYQTNQLIPALGYAAQAAANIPGLFTKAAKVNYGRVAPEKINLANERETLKGSRNLATALARKQAREADSTGMAMNYLAGANAGIMGEYGVEVGQSLTREATTNAQFRSGANETNAEISIREQDARTAEADAARSARQQALMNIGTIAAGAGKSFATTQQVDQQINNLGISGDYNAVDENGNLIINRKGYGFGGKRKRRKC